MVITIIRDVALRLVKHAQSVTKETTIQLRVKLISSKEKDRGDMNKLKYDDTEGRDISCGQDKNDFIIELVDIPKKRNQRDSHVQQIYF